MSDLFPGYKFQAGESGIFVEIYLPKKARFQGVLYQTLSDGFHIERVQEHLTQRFDEIARFMEEYYPFEFTKESIPHMPQVMGGYSLYEVDGVFYDSDAKAPVEERTQVVRIMFRTPDQSRLLASDPELRKQIVREFLRFTGDKARFAEHRPPGLVITPEQEAEFLLIIQQLRDWVTYVAVFIFGFVVYQFCKRIGELKNESGIRPEDEIWVTSFWNVGINRIIKLPEDKPEAAQA